MLQEFGNNVNILDTFGSHQWPQVRAIPEPQASLSTTSSWLWVLIRSVKTGPGPHALGGRMSTTGCCCLVMLPTLQTFIIFSPTPLVILSFFFCFTPTLPMPGMIAAENMSSWCGRRFPHGIQWDVPACVLRMPYPSIGSHYMYILATCSSMDRCRQVRV